MSISSWRPIETAPKDGTDVLLSYPALQRPTIGRFQEISRTVNGKEVSRSAGWHTDVGPFFSSPSQRGPEPTHWMPLPAAPEAVS